MQWLRQCVSCNSAHSFGSVLTDLEESEFARVSQHCKGITLHSIEGSLLPRLVDPKSEIRPKTQKEGHRDHLPDQACNHDMCSRERASVRPSSRSQATTGTLESQGEHIAADEDVCVELWSDSRVLATVDGDEAREAEVDGCGQKGGSDGQADKVAKQ